MGIQGLLPMLKECTTSTHVKEYKGRTLGIDAYVWLHRGAYGCAQEIATGQATVKYIKYAMHRIRLLKHYGVTPYVVFDGGLLPSKKGTENDRDSRRMEALSRANTLIAEGKHAHARDYFVKAVDVTPQMAYQLIKALIAEKVSYVVAPYEADAQLAYLEKRGLIDAIITEDSDLLVFGCKKVLFKMDSEGACMEIKQENFTRCKEFTFSGWTPADFRQMAILSGCDYLESIQGLGLKTAHKLMRKYKSADKVVKFIRLEGQLRVPPDYEKNLRKAEYTFLYQRVFCPLTKKLVHLEPLPLQMAGDAAISDALSFVGPHLQPEIVLGIATGQLCPLTKTAMVDIAPGFSANEESASSKNTTTPAKSITHYFRPNPSVDKKARTVLKEISTNSITANSGAKLTKHAVRCSPAKSMKSKFFQPTRKIRSPSQVAGDTASNLLSNACYDQTRKNTAPIDITDGEEEEDSSFGPRPDAHAIRPRGFQPLDGLQSEGGLARGCRDHSPIHLFSSPAKPLSESGFSHISSPPDNRHTLSPHEFAESIQRSYNQPYSCAPEGSHSSTLGSSSSFVVQEECEAEQRTSTSPSVAVDLTDISSPDKLMLSNTPNCSLQRAASISQSRKRKRSATAHSDKSTHEAMAHASTPLSLTPETSELSGSDDDLRSDELFEASSNTPICTQGQNRKKKADIAEICLEGSNEPEVISRKVKSLVASWREKFSNSSPVHSPLPRTSLSSARPRLRPKEGTDGRFSSSLLAVQKDSTHSKFTSSRCKLSSSRTGDIKSADIMSLTTRPTQKCNVNKKLLPSDSIEISDTEDGGHSPMSQEELDHAVSHISNKTFKALESFKYAITS